MNGIVLGTQDFRTRQFKCYDWSDLETVAGKLGRDRKAAGVDGLAVRPRTLGGLSGRLLFRTDGRWNGNLPRSGGQDAWKAAGRDAADTFVDLCAGNGRLAVVVWRPGENLTGTLQVEDPGPPSWPTPWRALWTVQFTVAEGRLEVGS